MNKTVLTYDRSNGDPYRRIFSILATRHTTPGLANIGNVVHIANSVEYDLFFSVRQ